MNSIIEKPDFVPAFLLAIPASKAANNGCS